MDALTYFAIILGIGIISVVVALFVVLRNWSQSRNGGARRVPSQPFSVSSARVHAILPGPGKPVVWVVSGKSYAHPADVTDPQQRAALDEFFGAVRAVLPAPTPLASAPATAPTVEPSAPDYAARFGALPNHSSQASTPATSPSALAHPASLVVPNVAPSFEEPTTLPTMPTPPVRRTYEEELELPLFQRLKSSFFSGGNNSTGSVTETLDRLERTAPPTMPKIEELDDLLQMRLANLPHAPTASIRPGVGGLLQIIVAGQVYEHIDEVPHDNVRAAIREAVQIWERRLT